MSTTVRSNNSNNLSSLSSPGHMDFPSRAEEMVVCIALLFEALFIVMGNLVTIVLFALEKELRERKSLFLVINMAFADVMLGAVSVPLFVYLKVGFQLWSITHEVGVVLDLFYLHFDIIFLQASLISAVFISCERFYAVYRPLKHRTLSTRAYAIVISVIWTLAIVASAMHFILANLISVIAAYYLSAVLFSIFLFIICVCNFCIWRKCKMRTISSHQQNRTAQNQRLTRTLLFVSAAAVMAWFPYVIVEYLLNVHNIFPAWQVYYTTIFLQYSNSFVNPIIYAFKIPEFRQSSIMWCLTRRAINGVDTKNKKGRTDTVAFDLSKVKQLRSLTDPSDTQQKFEHEFMDTKL